MKRLCRRRAMSPCDTSSRFSSPSQSWMKVFIYLSSGEQSRSLLLLLLSSYLFTPYDLKSYYAFKEKKKINCTYFAEPMSHINIYTVHISYIRSFLFHIFLFFCFQLLLLLLLEIVKGLGFLKHSPSRVVKGTVQPKSKTRFLSPVVLFIHLDCFGVSGRVLEYIGTKWPLLTGAQSAKKMTFNIQLNSFFTEIMTW